MLAFGSTLEEKYTRYEVFYIPAIIFSCRFSDKE